MSKSVYESACDSMQLELLKMRSKLSFEETNNFIKNISKKFSSKYMDIYELLKNKIFENESKESKTFGEIIKFVKEKRFNDFDLDVALDAISNIYDVTYEEAEGVYQKKEYWMSIHRLATKK